MTNYIVGIEITENKEDNYYTYKITNLVWDEEFSAWVNRYVLSRPYSHYNDLIEALHDNIMRWERDNKHVKNWDEKEAEERFNRDDYYQEPEVLTASV